MPVSIAETRPSAPGSQEKVFAYLTNASTFGTSVRRIDTHAASVFLAGERALKVKRAVRYPFLDYSTLAQRKAACQAEIEVNRRFAPDIYLRSVPITEQPDGSLAIGGEGNPVEWAVEMRRFDEGKTLDCLAERGAIDASLADTLGRAVAAAHSLSPVVDAEPWVSSLSSIIDQNNKAFQQEPQLFSPEQVDVLWHASQLAYRKIAELLFRRGTAGLVRRCHGDLHLGNIALIDDKPVLFDAIEFDRLIASGDVLYDLAFLLMDLSDRGPREAANIVLNRYLSETGRLEDLDGLAALPLFMSLRAAIRAKVTASRLELASADQYARIQMEADKYFQLANELIRPPAPVLVAIGGLSGTGKSVLARSLAPELKPSPGAVVLRTDVERKLMFETAECDPLPKKAYDPSATAAVYQRVLQKAQHVVRAGHSAIVDGVFAQANEREAFEKSAAAENVTFRPLYLMADLQTRVARVTSRVFDASDADASIARQQETYVLDHLDWAQIDASGCPADTLRRAREAIRTTGM
jgi:aminoglycoside phosphotransferase family enzyme/predicted kinase